MRRYASVGHRDKAEPFFIAAHKAAGDSVLQISVKDGPDLVIGWAGENHLIEVKSELTNEKKDGYTRKSKGKLKPGQEEFAKTWKGGHVLVTASVIESLRHVGHAADAIEAALWDAGLHWMMEAYKGPEPTPAQWKKCKARKCEHIAKLPKRRPEPGDAARARASGSERLKRDYVPPRGTGVDAAAEAAETFAPPPCPACRIDPQSPCKHDGEEKGVAMGTQPPRRKNQRNVDRLVAKALGDAVMGFNTFKVPTDDIRPEDMSQGGGPPGSRLPR